MQCNNLRCNNTNTKEKTMKFSKTLMAAAVAVAGLASPVFAQTTVHVFLWDAMDSMDMAEDHKIGDGAAKATDSMGIAVSVIEIPAGEVTFDVVNTAPDIEHEMVVTRLSGSDGSLPYNADDMAVDEEAAGSVGEVAELAPGASGALSVTLEPGSYALYCNVPGHYAAGMWTVITVK